MIFRKLAARRTALLAAVAATLLVTGCATGTFGNPEEVIVKERAHARWQALIKGDFEGAYKLAPPSYRAVYSLEQFRSKFGVALKWVGADVLRAQCDATRCEVVVNVTVRPVTRGRAADPVNAAVDERWIREDGQWWYFQR